MAIQGTQNTHYFSIFQIFQNFFFKFLYEKQNKEKLKRKTNKNMLSKAKHKN